MSFARFLFLLLVGSLAAPAVAQPPTADDVKSLKAKYADERTASPAAEKAFLPGLLERADELAKRADQALAGNRFFQAAELYRQARWQLPYLPTKLPDNVGRVFGTFRLRHGMEATAVEFSPDGKLLATGSSDQTVKLWDLSNGREVRSYAGHGHQIRTLAFSPDGKRIASGGLDADIHLWEVESGKLVRKITGPGTYVSSLTFSRDGKTLVSGHSGKIGGTGGYVAFHDVNTGERKRQIQDFRLVVHSVAFNHKGDVLAVGSADQSIRLYAYPKVIEKDNEPEYWNHQDNSGPITDVSFSTDDRWLIRCGADAIKIYPVAQAGQAFQVSAAKRTIANPDPEHHYVVALTSGDSKTLIAAATDGSVRLFDLESGQIVSRLRGHAGPIRSIALHPKGSQIASAGSDCMPRLWDFDVVLQARDYVGHDAPVWAANFSPDGRKVVSGSNDQTVRVWEVGAATPLHVLKGHRGPVTMTAFLPDGKRVVSAGADRTLKIWDADAGTMVRELAGHTGTVTALDVTPDGKRIVSGAADRIVKIWDVETGKEVVTLPPTSVVAAIAIAPEGDKFAAGHVDQTIGLYDMSGKLLRRWAAHGIAVSGLAFSPSGKWLASCGADQLVKVWSLDAPAAAPLVLSGHTGPLSSVGFRKDGQHLVSCGGDGSVRLWKIEGDVGKEVQVFRGHRDWVTSASFSKDGHYVVSSSVDRTVKLWEITSRDVPLVPEHTGTVDVVAFSADGKKIASGGSDRAIKIWDRGTGQEVTTIRGHGANVISLAFAPNGKSIASSSADRSIRFWDAESGKELPRSTTQQQAFTQMVNSSPLLSLTPDGKSLLVWISGQPQSFATIAVFDLEGNEKVAPFNDGDGRKIHSLCFSLDGSRAATGAANGSVRVWDVEKRSPVPGGDWFLFDDKTAVADLALTPDGKTIVVTSEKGEIKIADVAKRDVRKSFKGHNSKIAACLVSADGKRIATLDAENLVKLWDLATGNELRSWNLGPVMQDRASSVVSLAISPDGKHLLTGHANSTMFLLEAP